MKLKSIVLMLAVLSLNSLSFGQMNGSDPLGGFINKREQQVRNRLGLSDDEEIVYDMNQDEDADDPASSRFSLKTLINNDSESLGTGRTAEVNSNTSNCRGNQCPLFIRVYKGYQDVEIYEGGKLTYRWKVSSGWAPTYETPDYSGKPTRIYQSYTSRKYPGRGYVSKNGKNYGNMPFAVFYSGGFALHGTTSTQKLGQKASHGCIRLHPDHAELLNRLVRSYGPSSTWIYISK